VILPLKRRREESEELLEEEGDDNFISIRDKTDANDVVTDDDNSSDCDPGGFIRDNDIDSEDGDIYQSDSDCSSEDTDIPQPHFPGILKKEKMTLSERTALRNLKRFTSKTIRGSWNELDVLNHLMNPKMRRKFESDAQASRTFYPAPKQFMKPFKGRTANAFRDTAWYRMQTDINIMYRFIMWSLVKMEEGSINAAKKAIMSVVVPFIFHLLSRCQRERINVRYPQGVVNALYDDDTEPMIRPGHMKRAKRLAAQQKDLRTISSSFFGQGSRGRGNFRHQRSSFLGSQRTKRFGWNARKNQYYQQHQQQKPQQRNRFQQGKQQTSPKDHKN
jgi:hypothetical protein